MKKRLCAGWCGVLTLLVLPCLAFGSGFGINEQGAKAVAMGGAFVAQADDPSAVYYNPAGIVQLDGSQASVGVSPIFPSVSFTSNGTSGISGTSAGQTTDAKDQSWMIPNAYVTHKYSDTLSFGFGVFSNFGLGTLWPDNWEGRYITGADTAIIKTISVNPVVAFKPTEKLSFAFGPVLQHLDIELRYKKYIPPAYGGPLDDDVELKGKDWSGGWNVGLLYRISDNLKFGASYRSEVAHSVSDGTVSFSTQIPAIGLNNTGASASFKTPAIGYLGLAWTQGPLTLEFDGQWTEWSTYENLSVNYFTPVAGTTGINKAKNWRNVWAYRFGAQYVVTSNVDLRAGLIYDESPIPDDTVDPLVPSGDRWIYTVGAGFHFAGLTLDLAYNYLDDKGRNFDNPVGDVGAPATGRMTGSFGDEHAHILSASLSYKF